MTQPTAPRKLAPTDTTCRTALRHLGAALLSKANTVHVLEDVNPYYNNCGHYPEWVVVEKLVGDVSPDDVYRVKGMTCPYTVQDVYTTSDEATAVANRRNKASNESWRAFLSA